MSTPSNTPVSQYTSEQARKQLAEAADRVRVSRTDSRVGAAFTGGLAVLIALTLATVTLLRDNPVGVAVTMGAYAVALAMLLWWHRETFRISDRKWTRRDALGFGLTIALYTAGIFWESAAFPGWAIFAPYCILVSVPGIVAAVRMLRA